MDLKDQMICTFYIIDVAKLSSKKYVLTFISLVFESSHFSTPSQTLDIISHYLIYLSLTSISCL